MGEDLKYKVGDKVRIKSLDWYNENKDEDGIVELSTHVFVPGMSQFCGKIVTIEDVFEDIDDNAIYYMEEIDYDWTDEMIECKVEEEMSLDKAGQITDFEYEGLAYTLPEGYIFKDDNGNVIDTHKIVLEKKKQKYPNTVDRCRAIVGAMSGYGDFGYQAELITSFMSLLICRDAYWKIYGEEMGLGKPWEPDFTNDDEERYGIYTAANKVVKDFCGVGDVNTILTFPTEEMRDAFFNAFGDDIENCKELI